MLVSIDEIDNLKDILQKADTYGEIIILKDNKPAYRLLSVASPIDIENNKLLRSRIDLWEAMDMVLSEQPEKTLHAKDIAKEITIRELYFMKDGSPVTAVQIRARASHKPEYFECLKGNYIKLIKRYEK
jgi:hypothetical protein